VFERFSQPARSVLALAQEEAGLLNHSFIGTEHILLGLIREGEGLGGSVLRSLGISYDDVRDKVEEIIGLSGAPPGGAPAFTPRAKKVLELSLREALQLGHDSIGTEHLLLGIVREGEGVATVVLASLGLHPVRIRHDVMQHVTARSEELPAEGPGSRGDLPAAERSPAASEPCCPHCRARVTNEVRFRTIVVASDVEPEVGQVTIHVVYCRHCGTTLHMFKAD
jgi:ATP-dependent Clp protease ATP-binding subunit ClpC